MLLDECCKGIAVEIFGRWRGMSVAWGEKHLLSWVLAIGEMSLNTLYVHVSFVFSALFKKHFAVPGIKYKLWLGWRVMWVHLSLDIRQNEDDYRFCTKPTPVKERVMWMLAAAKSSRYSRHVSLVTRQRQQNPHSNSQYPATESKSWCFGRLN